MLAGKNGLGGFTIHLDLVIVIPNKLHPPTFTKSLDFTSEPELTMVFTIGNHSHFAIDLDLKKNYHGFYHKETHEQTLISQQFTVFDFLPNSIHLAPLPAEVVVSSSMISAFEKARRSAGGVHVRGPVRFINSSEFMNVG